jgi:hypothetical protein
MWMPKASNQLTRHHCLEHKNSQQWPKIFSGECPVQYKEVSVITESVINRDYSSFPAQTQHKDTEQFNEKNL